MSVTEQRGEITFSFKGEPIFSIISNAVADGYVYCVGRPKIGDIHLTILNSEGRLNWHISDKTYGNEAPKMKIIPLSGQTSSSVIKDRCEKITKKWKQGYHPNKCCFIMTGYLNLRIKRSIEKLNKNTNYFPIEFYFGYVKCDFQNGRRWKRVKIRDLLKLQNTTGFIKENRIIKMIQAKDDHIMLCYSERQLNNLITFILKLIGFEDYIRYIREQKGISIKKEFERYTIGNKNQSNNQFKSTVKKTRND